MKYIFTLVTILFAYPAIADIPQYLDDALSDIQNNKNSSQSYFVKKGVFFEANRFITPKASKIINEKYAKQSRALKYQYSRERKKIDSISEAGRDFNLGAEVFSEGLNIAASFLGKVPAAVIRASTYGFKKYINYKVDKVEQAGVKRMEDVLYKQLGKIRDSGRAVIIDTYNMSPKQLESYIEENVGSLDDLFDSASAEDKPFINAMKTQALQNVVRARQIRTDRINANQDVLIARNSASILAVSQTLDTFMIETNNSINELIRANVEIEKSITELQKISRNNSQRIEENAEDIRFLESFAFSQMSPDQQIEMLEKGKIVADETRRNTLIKEIEIAKEQKKIQETISKYISNTTNALKIASNLGIKDPLLEDIANAAGYAQAGLSVFTDITMNGPQGYFNAAVTMSSLFGGGSSGPSAEEQRHEQVMGMLNRLAQGQQEIIQRLDVIDQKIDNLLNLNITIINKIDKLSSTIQNNQRDLMTKLDDIHMSVYLNSRMLQDIADEDLKQCSSFNLVTNKLRNIYISNNKSLNYEGLRKDLKSPDLRHLYRCLEGIETKIKSKTEINTVFYQKTMVNDSGDVNVGTINRYKDLSNFFKIISNIKGYDSYLPYLILANFPIETVSSMRQKFSNMDATKLTSQEVVQSVLGTDLLLDQPDQHFTHLLSAPYVNKYFGDSLPNLKYFDFIDTSSSASSIKLLPIEDLLKIEGDNKIVTNLLINNFLPTINVALIQESIMSGDVIVPLIYEVLSSSDYEVGLKAMVAKIMNDNPMIKDNFKKYLFYTQLSKTNVSKVSIFNEIKTENFALVNKFLPSELGEYSKSETESGYKFTLSKVEGINIVFEMPSKSEIFANKMIYSYGFFNLMKLKADVINLASEVRLDTKFNGNLFNTFNNQMNHFSTKASLYNKEDLSMF